MRLFILTIALLLAADAYSQTTHKWLNINSNRLETLPVIEVKTFHDTALVISGANYIVQIRKTTGSVLTGSVILTTSSYVEGDYQGLFSQRYFTQHAIPLDTAQIIYDLYHKLKISDVPDYTNIKGWRLGNDGIMYSLEYTDGSSYSKKSYWSPWAFKELKDAVLIDTFVERVEDLLQWQKRRETFISQLPKGQSYRFGALSLITVADVPANTKWIRSIAISYQQADEPPVVGGRTRYELVFKEKDAALVCGEVLKGNNHVALEDTASLKPLLVKAILNWGKTKTEFSLRDLGIKSEQLAQHVNAKYQLTFPIPSDVSIDIDSLSFCNKYQMKKMVSTGGDHTSVVISFDDHKQEFHFEDNDPLSEFDLRGYLTCYTILNDAIPEEFPAYSFFSQDTLIGLIYEYQQAVECEGYYYNEYTSRHPELTARERRMMKGWNFTKYMKDTGRIK